VRAVIVFLGTRVELGFALAALVLTASCTYVEATSTQYAGVPRYDRTDPDKVQVLATEPRQRHERLGEVFVRASVEPPAAREDIDARLREEAARWGADAVYVMQDFAIPRERERKVVGVAVRYVR